MPWCHTCRVEYPPGSGPCHECGGVLVDQSAPERRLTPASAALRVVATLPPEDALLASGRLDAGGIPATLRQTDGGSYGDHAVRMQVLVAQEHVADARSLLRRLRRGGDPAHSRTLTMIAIVTAIALLLSTAMLIARWVLSGSPLPR